MKSKMITCLWKKKEQLRKPAQFKMPYKQRRPEVDLKFSFCNLSPLCRGTLRESECSQLRGRGSREDVGGAAREPRRPPSPAPPAQLRAPRPPPRAPAPTRVRPRFRDSISFWFGSTLIGWKRFNTRRAGELCLSWSEVVQILDWSQQSRVFSLQPSREREKESLRKIYCSLDSAGTLQ